MRKRKLPVKGKLRWLWNPKVNLIQIKFGCAEGDIYEFVCEAKFVTNEIIPFDLARQPVVKELNTTPGDVLSGCKGEKEEDTGKG